MFDYSDSVLQSPRWRDRFEIVRRLGRGGMGTVYEAVDHARHVRVALKLLRELDPELLLRFKKEFRAVADIHHPNLVLLDELFEDDGQWFFTMELVEGVDILDWIGIEAGDSAITTFDDIETGLSHISAAALPTRSETASTCDLKRLRPTLRQLAAALQALHQHGKIHRDVKPDNVKITSEGRLVLLDFGLVRDLESRDSLTKDQILGTPAYMAPEQTRVGEASQATDWYAFGVILFQALTAQLPFSGQPLSILRAKLERDAPTPSCVIDGVPTDLDRLCVKLLARPPEDRPRIDAIFDCLGSPETSNQALSLSRGETPFVDRKIELRRLSAALDGSRKRARVRVICGGAGIGKSRLIDHFCELAEGAGAIVLRGRCYERESMAYKGLDGVVEALLRALRDHPKTVASFDEEIARCAEVFPVLWRASPARGCPQASRFSASSPRERRRALFSSLRKLLSSVADRGLVVAIEDLHWADADTFTLWHGVFDGPSAPPMLLLGCARDDATWRPWLELPAEVEEIDLEPLSLESSRSLAEHLLSQQAGTLAFDPLSMLAECAGHPLFIEELMHGWSTDPKMAADGAGHDELIGRRIETLDGAERGLLELVCVAAQPTVQTIVREAAAIDSERFSRLVAKLRVARLVRTSGIRQGDDIEAYHKHIADVVRAEMRPEDLARRHRQLAVALEGHPNLADPERLFRFWLGAGQIEAAVEYACSAAEVAESRLAFGRAASLLNEAVELSTQEDPELLAHYAEALGKAGQALDSARQYLRAAENAEGLKATHWRSLAGEQYLLGGHIDHGTKIVADLVEEFGTRFPRNRRQQIFDLLKTRFVLALRGRLPLGKPRPAERCSPASLEAADLYFSFGLGYVLVEPRLAAVFLGRGLLLALKVKESRRLIRALCAEASLMAGRGVAGAHSARRTIDRARSLAESTGNLEDNRWLVMAEGVNSYLQGDWREARRHFADLEELARRLPYRSPWQLSVCKIWSGWCDYYAGELKHLASLTEEGIADAKMQGDLFALTGLSAGPGSIRMLVEDRPKELLNQLDETIARWSSSAFLVQHWWVLRARVEAALYEGDGETGRALLRQAAPQLAAYGMHRLAGLRIEYLDLSVRCRLIDANPGSDDAELRKLLKLQAARREAWAQPLSDAATGETLILAGDLAGGLERFERAERGFASTDMELHRQALLWRQGQLLGGDEGEAAIAGSKTWLEEQGVVDPKRFATRLMPGLE